MGAVVGGGLIELQSNECQPKDKARCKLVLDVGGQVVRVVGLVLSSSILQIYLCREGLLRIAKGGFESEEGWW